MNMSTQAQLPPLPPIKGDATELTLDLYTHDSMMTDAPPNDDYGDMHRLRDLGDHALHLAVHNHLFHKYPRLGLAEITTQATGFLGLQQIDSWVNSYGMKHRVRCSPEIRARLADDHIVSQQLFYGYVGAIFIRNGLADVQAWISKLIDPDSEPPRLAGQSSGSLPSMASPPRNPPAPGHHYAYQPQAQPQLAMQNPAPNPGAGGAAAFVTVALANQTAQQRGVTIAYEAQMQGQPHMPTWTVTCSINGIPKGTGVANSQKKAKEEAVKLAWTAMGW